MLTLKFQGPKLNIGNHKKNSYKNSLKNSRDFKLYQILDNLRKELVADVGGETKKS